MFTTSDQFSAASKASLGTQFDTFSAFTSKALENVEKIIGLNLSLAKASLEDSTVVSKQLFAATDPREFFAVGAAQFQPVAEKALTYGRHLASITSSAQSDFTKAAEEQFVEANRKVVTLIDEMAKNAPAGSENVVALVKSAVSNTSAGFEQLSKTTKQAVEAFEANLAATTERFAQNAPKAAGARTKA